MLSLDERFSIVNLGYLQSELESVTVPVTLERLVRAAIKEIEMHRTCNADYKRYQEFIRKEMLLI